MSTLHVENLKGLSSGGNVNKIIVPSGQTLDASNGFVAPAGHVIQVVNGSMGGSDLNLTSASWADIGLSAAITPSSTSSKIIVTASFQIPLGGHGFNKACLRAAETQIKGQEFALIKAKLEANLARMKICAEQLKLGVKFIGDDAVTCKNVVLTTVPNQVIPHTHKLK